LGENVAVRGFPLGLPLCLPLSVSKALVSGSERTIPSDGLKRGKLIQTDAAVNHWNSGCPLISLDNGEVIGLVDLGSADVNGLAFAVSSQVAKPLLQAWKVAPQPVVVAACSPAPFSADSSGRSSAGSASTHRNRWRGDARRPRLHDPLPILLGRRSRRSPEEWIIDTTIRDPQDPRALLRIDVSDNPPGNALSAAMPVVQAVRRQSGYKGACFEPDDVQRYDAVYWEFLVPEAGELLHKVDVFLNQ
jgi:Trypsin-like peptidase domain